jgi:putative oxygen-independent coproporphyrinogen III oxidase
LPQKVQIARQRSTGKRGDGWMPQENAYQGVNVTQAPDSQGFLQGFGVYVHVPFCRDRCDYCGFAIVVGQEHLAARYATAVEIELAAWKQRGVPLPASTVYFGGGTPSRLPVGLLAEILEAIPRLPGAEVTLEANPEDVTEKAIEAWSAAGVTRVSLGLQATEERVLAGLGRRQAACVGVQAARMLSEATRSSQGPSSWGADLIIGSPAERDTDLSGALETLLSLEEPPGQVSCYLLTVEQRSPLAREKWRHPKEDVLCKRYELADEVLSAHGYGWVEISNWARPGGACRHNLATWSGGEYLGLGPSACSHLAGVRWENARSLRRWMADVETGGVAVAQEEVLKPEQVALERLALSLRTPRGVPTWALERALTQHPEFSELLETQGDRLVLNRRGRLLCDALSVYLEPLAREDG